MLRFGAIDPTDEENLRWKKIQGGGSEMALRSMEIHVESVMARAVGKVKVKGEKIIPEIFWNVGESRTEVSHF